MCDNAPMTTNLTTPPTVTVTIPRSTARPFGILDRDQDVLLTPIDEAWLTRNVKDRMKPRHRKVLRKALTDAGVTL